jgi:eukaryotic-like serine/threonine-protein kinase
MALTQGTVVAGRYLVVAPLGAGGMGEVYRARDERLGRDVALKVLPAQALGNDAARARLIREARSAAQIEHPGIVHVYDVDETGDGGAFLVMELVQGKTLGQLLHEGALSLADRRRAIVEAARALAFAHGRGFMHRDVKPDNVMVREDGRAVVLDFGLAKLAFAAAGAAPPDAATITQEGVFIGTPAYVAPEQARGDAVDARADQFALGVVAYEALTGASPWHGTSPVSVLSQVLSVDPPAPTTLAPGLPKDLDAVIARAIAKRPEDRYPSVDAFADALEAIPLGSGPVAPISGEARARAMEATQEALPVVVRGATPAAATLAAATLAAAAAPRGGRARRLAAIGAGIALAAAAAFVAARLRSTPAPVSIATRPAATPSAWSARGRSRMSTCRRWGRCARCSPSCGEVKGEGIKRRGSAARPDSRDNSPVLDANG